MFAICVYAGSMARLSAQTKAANNKPWQELISTEGRFRVLLPDTPDERFIPVTGQILTSDVRVFVVKSDVAIYAVIFGELTDEGSDREVQKAILDNGRDHALAEGKLRLVSEKDLSSAGTLGRQYIMEDSAFVIRNRVYFNKNRVYETIFVSPGLNAMPPALVQYYDGLASKFFNSFKIGI
ncbi:MAG TPA: hypothetical protein VE863_07645 [Pyrinomonadaceae bacterium]|jgi:hypothetical protein|nr:hypothetical protein [Pyrinomonadaceae bacterium]